MPSPLSTTFLQNFQILFLKSLSNFAVVLILAYPPEDVNTVFAFFMYFFVSEKRKTEALIQQHFCPYDFDSKTEKEGFEPSRRLPDLHP